MEKFLLLLSFYLILSCSPNNKQENNKSTEVYRTTYAQGFSIKKFPDYTEVQILNPWDTTRILHTYILVPRDTQLPSNIPLGTVVRIPLKNVAVYSSVQCSMLEAIDARQTITGICDSRYITLPFIKKGLSSGKIKDLGESYSPDVEKIIELNPEAILVSPMENTGYGRVEKCGIPIIECSDYMENHPLGRTEWIRLLGLFFGQEGKADSLFSQTMTRYNELCNNLPQKVHKPSVFTETKLSSVWYQPGGNSYMACLLKDAGADYIWKNDSHTGSIALSFETVFEKAHQADIWLIKYNNEKDLTYQSLEKDYKPYNQFDAFKNKKIYGCNTLKSSYYDDLPLHPDYILKDMINIFHPGHLSDTSLKYFKKLNE